MNRRSFFRVALLSSAGLVGYAACPLFMNALVSKTYFSLGLKPAILSKVQRWPDSFSRNVTKSGMTLTPATFSKAFSEICLLDLHAECPN